MSAPRRTGSPKHIAADRHLDAVSLLLMAAALFAALVLDLLSALLAGLLLAQLVHSTVPLLNRIGIADHRIGKAIALGLVAAIIVIAVVLGVVGISTWLTAGPENLFFLLQRMAEAIDSARAHLPPWASAYLPANVEEFETAASQWLRDNAWQLRSVGREVGLFLTHTVIGLVIGGMIAYSRGTRETELGSLAAKLEERIAVLGRAFRNIVFSQVRISTLNTALTAIYLVLVLPLFGTHLPFVKTMIAVTFIVGLLPVIGNLVSNTVIVLVSLSIAPAIAAASLIFLVLIHKLEYFVNARIIGARIRARAWELLLAMLVMEAAFGIAGLIAAPIYYAYLKDELALRGLI
ncbi:MAG: AI-2E family transporter [Mesorhizobium sp.]